MSLDQQLSFDFAENDHGTPVKGKRRRPLPVPAARAQSSKPRMITLREMGGWLQQFNDFGKSTLIEPFPDAGVDLPVYINEYWTSKQRAAHSLQEVSYRACFKPQLPAFFINLLTRPGDVVYDPFMGRGTTPLEAALLGRVPCGADINPLSRIFLEPRLNAPQLDEIEDRLHEIDLADDGVELPGDLLVFYHPETLHALASMRSYFMIHDAARQMDHVDRWIRMVSTNRLTGHSNGFFSVYTLPPNQAVSVVSQRKINEKRNQVPPPRDIPKIVLKKSRQLLSRLTTADRKTLQAARGNSLFLTGSCDHTPEIADNSVSLVVTSPPFLDVVDYQTDNWLRCWFNGLDSKKIGIWQLRKPEQWVEAMTRVFRELHRVLRPGGAVAFEVGEVRGGKILMETLVVPAAVDAGLNPVLVMVNDQEFTKTANCWGVSNLKRGTNTNRIILLEKPPIPS
jgi:hypothetical protein